MAIPHRDNVVIRVTFGPDHHHHSLIQPANCEPTNLSVIEAVIDKCHGTTGEHLLRIGREIDPTLSQGDETLGGVEGEPSRD
jgi:hypothetical protein